MDTTIDRILEERGSRYGRYSDNARIAQKLKQAVEDDMDSNPLLEDHHRETIHMIFVKLARVINGDPNYLDNWRDISAYSELTMQIIKKSGQSTDSHVVYEK